MDYVIYTDGSYKQVDGVGPFYAGAALIYEKESGKCLAALTKVGNDSIVTMRNVAGEIIAVVMALEHCLSVLKLKKEDNVTIYYDYQGIEAWTLSKGTQGYWKAKNPTTQGYRSYINTVVKPAFNVQFSHVYGHTGVRGNEMVDSLAKKAIEEHVDNLRMGAE